MEIQEGTTVATCEYCGTTQTLPKLTDEKRANLYDRANHFRRNSEFDKAAAIYEQILIEDNTDSEAYWSLVLCRYGIEYIVDPISQRRVPTIRRAQYTSIFDDANYRSAVKIADNYQRVVYEEEATTINEIQKGILAISQKEDPFDVFICYKETDENGKRTQDSVIAQELYFDLKKEGLNVFFARITLEDKLGIAYEPYIFAALHSAKVMVVLGTNPEYFNSVWVKNEWGRYLSLIQSGEKKTLIPAYRDMDPYNLPIEFSHLQAQNMSKIGFMQDLTYGIKKILGKDRQVCNSENANTSTVDQEVAPILRRAFLFAEDGEFDSADEYAEKVLDIYPECSEAYVVKLLIEVGINKTSDLAQCQYPLSNSNNYKKAIRFANNEYRELLEGINRSIKERLDNNRKDEVYFYAINLINALKYEDAIQALKKISSHRDAQQKIEYCTQCLQNQRWESMYTDAVKRLNSADYDQAIYLFEELEDYKDSKEKIDLCIDLKENARKESIYRNALNAALSSSATDVIIQNSIEQLFTIRGYKDVDEQIRNLDDLIVEWRKTKEIEREEARIKAEEERVLRERMEEEKRIKSEKRKKTAKRAVLIGIPTVTLLALLLLVITIVLIIIFAFVVPSIQYSTANDLFDSGKYDEALDIYESLNGFEDSEKYISLINAIQKIDNSTFDDGIKDILSTGVAVEITYDPVGGTVTDSFEKNIKDSNSNYTFIYKSSDEFNGLVTPQKSGYHFVNWKLNKYNFIANDSFSIVFYAEWDSSEYTINYDLDGGELSETNPSQFNVESDDIHIVEPTRQGYTFAGWTGTNLESPTKSLTIEKGSIGDREYTANWIPCKYQINLSVNSGVLQEDSVDVEYDAEYTLPLPTRSGYTFTGWTYNGNEFKDGIWLIDYDITIDANWQANVYTLKYNDIDISSDNDFQYSDGSSVSVSVTYDDQFDLPVIYRDGYTFIGWYIDDLPIDSNAWCYDYDIELIPKWEANQYTISFDSDGGELSSYFLTVTYGEEYTLPIPNKSGFSFAGWFIDYVEYKNDVWTELDDISLTARWIANTYTATIKDIAPVRADIQVILDYNYSGAPKTSITLSDGMELPYPDVPARDGFVFTGWYTNENCTSIYDFSGIIEEDLILYAGWAKHLSDIESSTNILPFNYTSIKTLKLSTSNTSANSHHYLYLVANESGTHKIFYKNGSANSDYSTYIKVLNLNSNSVVKNNSLCYSITYESISFSCNKGDVIVIDFYRYFLDTTVYFYFEGFTSPISSAYAESKTISGYHYDSNSTKSDRIIYGNDFVLPTPAREGYSFVGWFVNDTEVFSGKWTYLSDITFVPRWEVCSNVITFNADGGSLPTTSLKVYYNEKYVLPTPVKSGSTFLGWYSNGIQISSGTWKGNYDLTLTAKWTTDKFSVTFEDIAQSNDRVTLFFNYNYSLDGSVEIDSVSYTNGQNINYPEVPTRNGYVFLGWFTDKDCTQRFNFLGALTEDIVLYAGWRQMSTLAVHSAYQIAPTSYRGPAESLTQSTNGTSITSKKYYYFVAQEFGAHSIFYKNSASASNGAFALEIKNYTTGEEIFISNSVSNTEFLEKSFNCSKGDIIVVSFYRISSLTSTEVSFYFEGFTNPTSSLVATPPPSGVYFSEGAAYIEAVQYGESYKLPTPTREGYTFEGWYYGTRKINDGTWTFTQNVTLTAKWIANK